MKKRYVYALLFGFPGLFVSGILCLLVFGGLLGFFWLFVFGDNPWPSSIDTILVILLVLTFLISWTGFILLGYVTGRRLEKDPAWNWNHILLSAGLTVLFILFLVFQQWSVGNIGPKSDSLLCSDYCVAQGYAGSGMPPRDSGERTCSCYDSSGNEALKVPLDSIDPDAFK
jgi:hypothetical protein